MSSPHASPVQPRPAATLVILRDSPRGLECVVTLRPRSLRFMGGATVFPGGAVDEADCDPRWEQVAALDREAASELLDEPDGALALGSFVCALREAHEEVGFPLAAGGGRRERFAAARPHDFLEACLAGGESLRTDWLVPIGRWATPLGAPVRFDARFFAARAPSGWEPIPDAREVEDCRWATAREALDELARGDAIMAPPTIEMFQRLVEFDDVETALEGLAATREAHHMISTRVAPSVHLVLAPNPGLMTGPGTNTYVVGEGPRCVIDPAVDDEGYIREVRRIAGDVRCILITHRDGDHVGGIEALAAATGAPVRAFGPEPAGGIRVVPLADGEEVVCGEVRLRAMHTPGHAPDHLCFHDEANALLFSGDNILGEGTSVIAPPRGNMADYLATLDRLAELEIRRIFPGHFRPLDAGPEIIRGYIEHRAKREDKVLAALSEGALSVEDIVRRAWDDTPQELHPVAQLSALAHLEMLEGQGRVTRAAGKWRMLEPTPREATD